MTRRKAFAHGPEAKARRVEAAMSSGWEFDADMVAEPEPLFEPITWSPEVEAMRKSAEMRMYLNEWVFAWWISRFETLFHYRRARNEHYMFSELEKYGVIQ